MTPARVLIGVGIAMTKQYGPPGSKQPLKPSNDTVRIATALGCASSETADAESHDEALLGIVEAAIHERALRSDYLPGELLTDVAWDMLLELLHVELEGRSLTASVLCKAAGVSGSTGLRWIDVLESKGLCTKTERDDPSRALVELSAEGSKALRGYFLRTAASSE